MPNNPMTDHLMSGHQVTDDLERKIRDRAYHLWRESGCAEGDADRHWLAAERDVLAGFAASATTAAVPSPHRTDGHATVTQAGPQSKAKAHAGGKGRRARR